ncbi:MAG: response regulator [Limisphaerales bacterium]
MDTTNKRRVLVLDDDPILTDLLVRALKAEGYHAEGVNRADEARDRLANGLADGGQSVEMMCMDVDMPDITGFDLLKEIRETRSAIDLPIIMVTGHDATEDVVSALDSAANDYVTKPVDFPVLLARMRTHLALKDVHERLRSSQRSLIHTAKMESVVHLAGGFAKEIRQPLAQVRMGMRNLSPSLPEDDKSAHDQLEQMGNSLKEADAIVSQLISSSSANRLQFEPMELSEFVDEMLGLLAEALKAADVSCEVKLEKSRPVALMAAAEMTQVFLNVALNAVQATPAGGKIIVRIGERRIGSSIPDLENTRIGARLHPGDTAAAFEIEDSGPGLNEEELERVFDPFFQGRTCGPGAGLGLTVAKKIIELHGGVIEVENKSFGEGGKATVMLRQQPPVAV